MIQKSITIKEKHKKWLEDNSINLSRFVKKKIDEEIKKKVIK